MRATRVRRLVRKRQFIASMTVIAVALMLVPAMVLAKGKPADGPHKVAICHFDGHDPDTALGSQGFTGDYVIDYGSNGPTATFCEGVGGMMIIVSVNALDGHRVEGADRVDTYPDGWKGF